MPKVEDNLLEPLKAHYGAPKRNGADQAAWLRNWEKAFSRYTVDSLRGAADAYILQDKFDRFPAIGAMEIILRDMGEIIASDAYVTETGKIENAKLADICRHWEKGEDFLAKYPAEEHHRIRSLAFQGNLKRICANKDQPKPGERGFEHVLKLRWQRAMQIASELGWLDQLEYAVNAGKRAEQATLDLINSLTQ